MALTALLTQNNILPLKEKEESFNKSYLENYNIVVIDKNTLFFKTCLHCIINCSASKLKFPVQTQKQKQKQNKQNRNKKEKTKQNKNNQTNNQSNKKRQTFQNNLSTSNV